MRPDVSSLRRFYQTPIGRGVAHCLSQKILHHWSAGHLKKEGGDKASVTSAPIPALAKMDVMGLGYAVPVLDSLMTSGAELFALMPGGQGATLWPQMDAWTSDDGSEKACHKTAAQSRVILVDDYHLPLCDGSVDRMILLHALEYTSRPAALLRECWRVLKPGGKVMVVVPHRSRTWSAMEHTPFGHGTPYSRGQLLSLLEDQLLYATYISSALMIPPFKMPGIERGIKVSEVALRGAFEMLGGLLVIEAEKRIYGSLSPMKGARQPVRVFHGI